MSVVFEGADVKKEIKFKQAIRGMGRDGLHHRRWRLLKVLVRERVAGGDALRGVVVEHARQERQCLAGLQVTAMRVHLRVKQAVVSPATKDESKKDATAGELGTHCQVATCFHSGSVAQSGHFSVVSEPSTANIFSTWSRWKTRGLVLSSFPGKRGEQMSSSAKMQPMAQTSMARV